MHFRATLELDGRTATGIPVPAEVIDGLGGGKRPPVGVTIGDHTFRTTVGSVGGVPRIPVSAAVRAAAGIAAGDVLDVTVELDTEPREMALPADLAAALEARPDARQFFDGLSPSRRKAYATWVESAKKAETRARRVEKAVVMLAEGRPQP